MTAIGVVTDLRSGGCRSTWKFSTGERRSGGGHISLARRTALQAGRSSPVRGPSRISRKSGRAGDCQERLALRRPLHPTVHCPLPGLANRVSKALRVGRSRPVAQESPGREWQIPSHLAPQPPPACAPAKGFFYHPTGHQCAWRDYTIVQIASRTTPTLDWMVGRCFQVPVSIQLTA